MCGQRSSMATMPSGVWASSTSSRRGVTRRIAPGGSASRSQRGFERRARAAPGARQLRRERDGSGGWSWARSYREDMERPRWRSDRGRRLEERWCRGLRRAEVTGSVPAPGAPPGRGAADRSRVASLRSGISLIATAARAATIAPTTPSQKVWRGREAERPVDALDDLVDDGAMTAWNCGRDAAEDRCAAGRRHRSAARVERPLAARLAEARDDRLGARRPPPIWGTSCSREVVPKIVPTNASAIVPPIWRKNVRFEVATPSSLERDGVLDDDRRDRERRARRRGRR